MQERETKGLSQQSHSGSLRAEVKLGERTRPGGLQNRSQEAWRGRAKAGLAVPGGSLSCRESQALGALKRSRTREQREAD